jgi:hypothetical protein
VYEINFLLCQIPTLSNAARKRIYMTACEMVRDQLEGKNVKGDGFEGRVTTEFTDAVVGQLSGISFTAELETQFGNGKIRFFIRDEHIVRSLKEEPDLISAGAPVEIRRRKSLVH